MRFRPSWVPTLAMAGAVVILSSLGLWQLRRLEEKRTLLAEWVTRTTLPPLGSVEALAAPERHEFRRVRARGRYDPAQSVLLLHIPKGLHSGAHVLTPLRLSGPHQRVGAVLVDRGWIPEERVETFFDSDRLDAEVEVVGVLRPIDFGGIPGAPARRLARWTRLRPRLLQAQIPYPLAPVLLQREKGPAGELPEGGFDPPRSRVDHRSYAITWFSMAAMAVASWVGLGLKQAREESGG